MGFGENLFNNLLVIGILGSLIIIIYCRMKNKTLSEVIKEIREGLRAPLPGDEYYE